MKRFIAALILLVLLAPSVRGQTYNTSADSAGVTTTTPASNTNMNSETNNTTTSGSTSGSAMNGTSSTSSKLPKTASPLPLLSLGGLGALASSWWLSRRRRA